MVMTMTLLEVPLSPAPLFWHSSVHLEAHDTPVSRLAWTMPSETAWWDTHPLCMSTITHTHGLQENIEDCSAAATRPSVEGAAIMNQENHEN